MHGKYNHKIVNYYAEFLQKCDLKTYEELCPKCNGFGDIYCTKTNEYETCGYCKGMGKIDWIDKIKKGNKNENREL